MPVVISNPVIPCTAARSPVQSIPYEIVSISSAAKHKNLRQAYSAALRFADKRKDVIFYFAGPWRKEDFQSLGQHNNVRLLSYVSAERKVQLISRCAAFLVPSTYEGFGIPYVEAASCGVALICSDIDIAQEIVGDYFYPIKKPFGVTEIFDAIVEAYAQEFKPKSDGILIASRYDPKAVASRYMDEVRKIAEF
jgi:glycosyltransferase involved in cell wall biosynthesis